MSEFNQEKDYQFYKEFYEENRIRILQYESLRNNFSKMIKDIFKDDYYNMGMDVYSCDQEACEQLTQRANETWLSRLLRKD